MDVWINGDIDILMDGRVDVWMGDGWTDGWMIEFIYE